MAKTIARKAKKKPAARQSKKRTTVRVRMYRHGLGDCFLLTFRKNGGKEFHVLIDCGIIIGTPDADTLMREVVKDIAAATKNHIHVLVVTHEHWDHVSGFEQAKDLFDKLKVDRVWMAWTENPKNAVANRLRREREEKLAALWLGVHRMRSIGAAADPAARQSLERAAEVLSFFGIDPGSEPPAVGGFVAVTAEAGGKTGAAMKWARTKTAKPAFWSPGDIADLTDEAGVRVYVLGPPTDLKRLGKDSPTKKGKETYEEVGGHGATAARSFFATAFRASEPDGLRPEFDSSSPFDSKYKIGMKSARQMDFFREQYFGDDDLWRSVERDWMGGAAEFALQLDSDTNNTSLALAFELPDGQVLLFPGDAQVGNWESWHEDGDAVRTWQANGGKATVTAQQILNRTVLYKVGHHGSHNATIRSKGLEMMTDPRLVAMVPVDVFIAHEKKKWTRMPFLPLMSRLQELTKGRVLQSDQPTKTVGRDAKKKIKVAHDKNSTGDRPLYVDYTLTSDL